MPLYGIGGIGGIGGRFIHDAAPSCEAPGHGAEPGGYIGNGAGPSGAWPSPCGGKVSCGGGKGCSWTNGGAGGTVNGS